MPRKQLLSKNSTIRAFGALGALLFATFAVPAQATQPLNEFLAAAHTNDFDARIQAATADARDWEAQAALGRLLPGLAARGTYTRNQYEAELPPGTFPGQTDPVSIQPRDQLDATFTLNVPLVDLSQYARYGQAKHLSAASKAQIDAVRTDLDRAVARSYYTFVGASALALAAQRSLVLAEDNLQLVRNRHDAGAATMIDLERARANVERAKVDLTDANLITIRAARNLETLSGLLPEGVKAYPNDDLHHEAPLAEWMAAKDTPFERVQFHLQQAAQSSKKAASRAMLPTLSANATERITNASGFTGQASSYTLQALLSWNIDYNKYASSRAQSESLRVEEIRTEQTQRRVQDAIFNAYHEVEASIAKSESARAAADATRKAAELALERYQAGALTQLEVVQSQRDAFGAQAERVKADADLALSRVTLRLAAGKSVDVPASRLPPISVDELQPPELSSSDSGDSSPQAAPGSDTTAPQ